MAIYTTQTELYHQYIVIKSRNREVLNLLDLLPNTIIHISEQAELELHVGTGEYNHNISIVITKGSKLEILENQTWTGNLQWDIDLIEPYAEVKYITRLEVETNSKNLITINHQAAYTKSKVDSRYSVSSSYKINQHTIINIPEGMISCQAGQSAEILLLTDRPQIKIIPELRVATDNSNTSHGVSIHPIKERDMFYLMSRGIAKKKAIDTLKKGFLEDGDI